MRSSCLLVVAALLASCGGGGGGGGDDDLLVVVSNLNDAGGGSLRAAIAAVSPGGTIQFDGAIAGGTIVLTSGTLTIGKELTIDGITANPVTVDGNGASRVLDVLAGLRVIIRDLVITGGTGTGAGIRNQGILDLVGVVLFNNQTGGTGRGGGFQNSGSMLCEDCTIQGNQASNGAGFANDRGTLEMIACTIAGNMTTNNAGGGGVNDSGTVNCLNCTFSGNTAASAGGALFVGAPFDFAIVNLFFCTITNNQAATNGGGLVARDDPNVISIALRGTIVAGNVATGPADIDGTFATVVSNGFNVIGDDDTSGIVNGANGDQAGSSGALLDPLLGPLTDNGGTTLTHALLAGSPALGAVSAGNCKDRDGNDVEVDQRGSARTNGGPCDAGSFEVP